MRNLCVGALFSFLLSVPTAWSKPRYTDEQIEKAREATVASPQDPAGFVELGKLLLRKYEATENKQFHHQSMVALEKAVSLDSKSAQALVYRGLLDCVRAREDKSKDLAREGLKLMDQARELEPENTGVAYLQGSVCIEVPKGWNRRDEGIQRLEAVAKSLEQDPTKAETYDFDLAEVHYKIAKAYRDRREYDTATVHWQKVIELAPDSDEAERSRRYIDKFSVSQRPGIGWSGPGH